MADITRTCSMVYSKSGVYATTNTTGIQFQENTTTPNVADTSPTATNSWQSMDKGAITTIGRVTVRSMSSSSTDVLLVDLLGGTTGQVYVPSGSCESWVINSATAPKFKWSAGANHQIQIWITEV